MDKPEVIGIAEDGVEESKVKEDNLNLPGNILRTQRQKSRMTKVKKMRAMTTKAT